MSSRGIIKLMKTESRTNYNQQNSPTKRERETKKSSMAATVACALSRGFTGGRTSPQKGNCSRERPSVRMKIKANDYSIHSKQLKWQKEINYLLINLFFCDSARAAPPACPFSSRVSWKMTKWRVIDLSRQINNRLLVKCFSFFT